MSTIAPESSDRLQNRMGKGKVLKVKLRLGIARFRGNKSTGPPLQVRHHGARSRLVQRVCGVGPDDPSLRHYSEYAFRMVDYHCQPDLSFPGPFDLENGDGSFQHSGGETTSVLQIAIFLQIYGHYISVALVSAWLQNMPKFAPHPKS